MTEPPIEWIETPQSSLVRRFRYDAKRRRLTVELKERAYVYLDVPESIFEQMKAAESKGRFLNKNVRNVYRYERI